MPQIVIRKFYPEKRGGILWKWYNDNHSGVHKSITDCVQDAMKTFLKEGRSLAGEDIYIKLGSNLIPLRLYADGVFYRQIFTTDYKNEDND